MEQQRENDGKPAEAPKTPSIELPKGGGALRATDEKFSVNAANGTCNLSIPLPFSKARSALGTALAIEYNSGSGNSAFGLGWGLNLPSIQRRTDKQLPLYEDADESDVFVFLGAEDLVPAYLQDSQGHWSRDLTVHGGIKVERYRPRIEGLFARIEKITLAGEPAFYWKVTTRDNVTTVFGRTATARIADPLRAERVFRWLPEWAYDDQGNCVEYVYKDEDLVNVPDVVEEKNRLSGLAPITNKYLKRVRYGNGQPYFASPAQAFDPAPPDNPGYFFETVLDYGEHDLAAPAPEEAQTWPCRYDPFSDCRAGFEVRGYRLCRRVLFFHSFAELDFYPEAYLVRSLDLEYAQFRFDNAPYQSVEADYITTIQRTHYKKIAASAYERKSWPAMEVSYQPLAWNKRVQTITPDNVIGAPGGVSRNCLWLDLNGEGVSGILSEDTGAWYYKSNLGNGEFSRPTLVAPKPACAGVATGAWQFQDLNADGSRQLVCLSAEPRGYFELDDDNDWLPFRPFDQLPNLPLNDPNAKLLDLNGDGTPDLLVTEECVLRWYPSLGTRGFDRAQYTAKPYDEEIGPAVLFGDGTQSIVTADMTGDGLSDIVRVRNGEICYWPNLGYGRFGAKVTMRNAPHFDLPDRFDPTQVQFADISGTGAADMIYLGRGGFLAWINLAGNAWSDTQTIAPFPGTESPNRVTVMDLLGNGTGCLVWSSELPANAAAPLRYVDLMGGKKPYIASGYKNNFGCEVALEYKSSTYFALLDKSEGRPWATKLPFPTMCVSRTETKDVVSGSLYVREYRYRHGYFDHGEREFRGFGMVEETDTETFEQFAASGAGNVVDRSVFQPPVRTRTWYHTGAYIDGVAILQQFAADYYQRETTPEHVLPDAVLDTPSSLTPDDLRQAARACKGMMLRQEVYADDGSSLAIIPYSTATHNSYIRVLQPTLTNRYAVFLTHESEVITYHYERSPDDPRIAHDLHTVVDDVGNVIETASVVYGRKSVDPSLPPAVQAEQARLRAIYTLSTYTNDVDTDSAWRVRLPCETQSFELTGVQPKAGYFTLEEIRNLFHAASPLPYEQQPHPSVVEKRLFHDQRTLYASDSDVNQALPLHGLDPLGLHYEDYRLAFTPTLLAALFAARVTDAMLAEGAYLKGDDYVASGLFPAADPSGNRWTRSGTVQYPAHPDQHFYLPTQYTDPFGNVTQVHYYGAYHLLIDLITDPLLNLTTVETFDFRYLQPQASRDINNNRSEVSFDIFGLVVGFALEGKGAEADNLIGFQPDLSQAQVDAFVADPSTNGSVLLANATSRFVYDVDTVPAVAASIVREAHAKDALASGVPSRLQYAFEYTNGLGKVAMKKVQTEPGRARQAIVNPDGTVTVTEIDTTPNLRWIGTGRTVINNKGNPVLQYEPYFSVTPAYETAEELVAAGVTPVFYYDPLSRPIRTEFPDGSYSTVDFDAWKQRTSDRNDNVLASDWYAARIGGGMGAAEQAAAQSSALHDDTPSVMSFDSLGRPIYTLEDNKFIDRTTNTIKEAFYGSSFVLDITGNRLAVVDPRGNQVMSYAYNLADHADATTSMDAGLRHALVDTAGQPLYGWDARGNRFHTVYDALRRPMQREVLLPTNTTLVYEKSVYGTDATKNQNGRLILQYDKSGEVTNDLYDFKGNPLSMTRRYASEYKADIDWANPATVPLAPTAHATLSTYDALNRVVTNTTPDNSVTSYGYDESGLLTRVSATLRGGPSQAFINKITRDEKLRRQDVDYANGCVTTLTYDPTTYRLRRLLTLRGGTSLQDLNYTYDPVGNVTQIRDAAQQTTYFNNQVVAPQNDFTYDAIYRLVSATGREHIGQNTPVSQFDATRVNLPHPSDGTKMQRYLQQYDYDPAGNLLAMAHSSGVGPYTSQWTRQFTPASSSNRLSSSQVGATTESYAYDAHGNATSMPGMSTLAWDFDDHLHEVELGGGGTAYYAYDTKGSRTRKVIERVGGVVEERLYLGGLEIFTRTQNGVTLLQRETLHVMDGGRRLAMVDARVAGNDGTPAQLIRCQFTNHLETAALELDDAGQIISYEEYYPYGSTSFQSVDASREVPAKRYRYTGKERDEETGLSYHGARYYAPWLARWINCDPIGVKGGANLYGYSTDNPVKFSDPTGQQPQLMGLWEYGKKIANRASLGRNVQLDHPIQVSLRTAQRTAPSGTAYYSRAISKAEKELTVAVETGKGLFHTEVGKLQAAIRQQAISGAIQHESDLVAATQAAYVQAGATTSTTVNTLARDTAILSNQATVHVTTAETVNELRALTPGATTVTDATIEAAFGGASKLAKVEEATVATSKFAGKTEAVLAAAGKVAKAVAPVAKVLKPLAPVAKVAGKIAGPLGIGISAVELATAKTTDQKIDASIGLASNALLASDHPVAMAAGAGLAAGQYLEKNLNVSEFSSQHGLDAQAFATKLGAGETTALVTGAVVTVVSTPYALGEAAGAKLVSWFK